MKELLTGLTDRVVSLPLASTPLTVNPTAPVRFCNKALTVIFDPLGLPSLSNVNT